MRNQWALWCVLSIVFTGQAARAADDMPVRRLDPSVDRLVAADTRLKTLLERETTFEGPTWVRDGRSGYLIFTDVPGNVIDKVTPDASVSVFLDHLFTGKDPSEAVQSFGSNGEPKFRMLGANGTTLDPQGRVVYCELSDGQVVRLERDGTRTVLASRFEGKRFNRANDLVYRSDGALFFTDSGKSEKRSEGEGLPYKGLYMLKGGEVHLLSNEIDHPNGAAFSVDEKHLYVTNSLQKNVLQFDVLADRIINEKVLIDMSGEPGQGVPDGVKLDQNGNIYSTGPGGVWIISPDGKHLGTILTPRHVNNLAFGGTDLKTLYMAAFGALYEIRMKVAGNPVNHIPESSPAGDAKSTLTDLQRSYQMDRYDDIADRGPARGEDIYFFKCFVCHNHYAKGGPALEGLFQRPTLSHGTAVTDQSVAGVIRSGSGGMPGFGHSLTDADMDDVVAYLKSPGCCYEADHPPVNPLYRAEEHPWSVAHALRGGVHGKVRNAQGDALQAIKVQLIAPNGVRTTVTTDVDGTYEFPVMQTGDYVLRVATPLSYQPLQRDRVRVEGNRPLDDLVLTQVPNAVEGALPGVLPATAEIASQLSGSELLWNLPGTDLEKTAFIRTCGIGCHDLKEILRNRFDEGSWRTIVTWMTSRGSASAFMVRPARPTLTPDAELVVKWLSRVRGPDSVDAPYRSFPRTAQASAHAVITEYELPRRFLSVHEVSGDSKGNIWYTSHRTPYIGVLDPRTGVVREFQVPDVPGTFPGTYKVEVGRNDFVWLSQSWAHRMTRLDPRTSTFKQLLIETSAPLNAGPWGNFGLAPDGFLWSEHDNNTIVKLDPEDGKILNTYPLRSNPNPADDLISRDGRYWAGGSPTMGNNTAMILDIRSGTMYETNSGDVPLSPARGGFDSHDNAWFGGHLGSFVEVVNEIAQGKGIHLRAFAPPTPYFPYSTFYTAVPDRNGDVWGAWIHGPGFVRFSPKTDTWRLYETPEPSAFARSTWVDNSTTPVSIWYPDYQMGTLVRIQVSD